MTKQSPRIYLYKITFEEVPYYYYGIHKEKYFNEEYWGTPITHKWCWKLYTPQKQILQLFDFTDDGWLEALEIERRIIKKFYITDKWCLNENCGGNFSLNVRRRNGYKVYYEGKGIHSRTKEEMKEQGRKNAEKLRENKRGIFGMSTEERKKSGSKNGKKTKKNKNGIFGLTKEQMTENAKKGVQIQKELGLGIFALTKEQLSENSKKANSQKWICLETGYITNAGALSTYQKKRGIDTSRRERIL